MVLVIAGLMCFGGVSYAQTSGTNPAGASTIRKPLGALIERSEGKITALEQAEPSKGNYGKVTLVDLTGKKIDFDLIAKTQVYSKDSAPLVFADLKKKDQVIVLYVRTLKGMNNVITITQAK